MAFELIASHGAPNVRRTLDGVRLTGKAGESSTDAFAAWVSCTKR